MVQKNRQPLSKPLMPGIVSLFVLGLMLLACSRSATPPVKYKNFETLKNDCPTLLSKQQKVSVSGMLNLHDSTVCVTDSNGEYCKILLGSEEAGLDIWMKTGGKNGMDDLPDPYRSFELVVHSDDGEELSANDMVTTTLEMFKDKEDGKEVCSFRVKTILRSKIEAAENQPGEGIVNLSIPANVPWTDTSIYVNQGQHLLIIPGFASYNLQDEDPNWDAISYSMTGVSDALCDINCVINGANYGMLVAKIDEGQPFLLTIETSDIIVPANGELFLTVNDCAGCYGNNSGSFDVVINLFNSP